MKAVQIQRQKVRQKRTWRVRKKLRGTTLKPRMTVVKSNQHISVQIIDDEKGITLASTGTNTKEFQGTEFSKKNKASAKKVGQKIAELAQKADVQEVVFDRGRFKYHGVLLELANAAREAGLKF